ncbi:bone morphogenetic protein receptor type-1A-like, partial [Pocillopora damicornis]|uniref:bone morphogenetic protein receptor type-1A-like n=2 Tax=Pocillopora TaxID=46730 RepID=UPI000F558C92
MATKGGLCFFFMVFFVFLYLLAQALSLRCRCSTHSCPGDHDNETCTTEGKCYKKVEPGVDDSYELITYGCLPPDEKTSMQCNTPDHVHKKQLSMECCQDGDMCNTFLKPTLPTTPSPTTGETVEEEFEDGVTEQYSILFISAGVCVVVFIIFLSVLCYR